MKLALLTYSPFPVQGRCRASIALRNPRYQKEEKKEKKEKKTSMLEYWRMCTEYWISRSTPST
jgi:3-phosphoglycerate kinase